MATRTTENTEEQVPDNPLLTTEIIKIKQDKEGKFKNFTRSLFSKINLWPQPETKPGRWLQLQPQHEICSSKLIGDFHHIPENADYRILGMRAKRTVGMCTEYDVCRLLKNSYRMRGFVREIVPRDYCDYCLRLCESDEKEDQKRFVQSLELFSVIQETVPSMMVRQHFPVVMGGGAFTRLFYKDLEDNETQAHCIHLINRPRPYYIIERLGPTFEELLRGSYYGFFDIPTARFLTIGAIKGLRTLHSMGIVHRCVTSYTLAIRTLPGGLMDSGDISNHVVVTDASFSCRYRTKTLPSAATPFVGTLKYSSPWAMSRKPQYPRDDVISTLYLFVELIHGKLPWRGLKDEAEILKKKQDFHKEPDILVDNIDPECRVPIDIRDLSLIFKMLNEANPFRPDLSYTYIYEILHRIAEANKQATYESFFDLHQGTSFDNDFIKLAQGVNTTLKTCKDESKNAQKSKNQKPVKEDSSKVEKNAKKGKSEGKDKSKSKSKQSKDHEKDNKKDKRDKDKSKDRAAKNKDLDRSKDGKKNHTKDRSKDRTTKKDKTKEMQKDKTDERKTKKGEKDRTEDRKTKKGDKDRTEDKKAKKEKTKEIQKDKTDERKTKKGDKDRTEDRKAKKGEKDGTEDRKTKKGDKDRSKNREKKESKKTKEEKIKKSSQKDESEERSPVTPMAPIPTSTAKKTGKSPTSPAPKKTQGSPTASPVSPMKKTQASPTASPTASPAPKSAKTQKSSLNPSSSSNVTDKPPEASQSKMNVAPPVNPDDKTVTVDLDNVKESQDKKKGEKSTVATTPKSRKQTSKKEKPLDRSEKPKKGSNPETLKSKMSTKDSKPKATSKEKIKDGVDVKKNMSKEKVKKDPSLASTQ